MRRAIVVVTFLGTVGCDVGTSEPRPDPYQDEVPLSYQKVFRQPRLNDLHTGDLGEVRRKWAAGMSDLGSEAKLSIDGDTLVVTYGATDRRCVAEKWELALRLTIQNLEMQSVRCASGGPTALVPDDGGRAKRKKLVERASDLMFNRNDKHAAGIVWHESDGMVITVIVHEGACHKKRLATVNSMLKKAGVELGAAGFEKMVCSVDEGEISLR